MVRRARTEEHENHERWLVSYADFITLLFAFFVVMYSISSVNEGKYKVLSETMVGVFNNPQRSLDPMQVGDVTRQASSSNTIDFIDAQNPLDVVSEKTGAEQRDETLDDIADQVRFEFGDLIDQDLISVKGNELWVEIELKSSILFESGSAVLGERAQPILQDITDILRPYENPIQVEGFTDNVPIYTEEFPSNWELSSSRAAAVVRLFANENISPTRMAAVGYGEFQPIADNTTEEGRQKNRRVVLVVSRDASRNKSSAVLDKNKDVKGGELPFANPKGLSQRESASESKKEPSIEDVFDFSRDKQGNQQQNVASSLQNSGSSAENLTQSGEQGVRESVVERQRQRQLNRISENLTIQPIRTEDGGLLFTQPATEE